MPDFASVTGVPNLPPEDAKEDVTIGDSKDRVNNRLRPLSVKTRECILLPLSHFQDEATLSCDAAIDFVHNRGNGMALSMDVTGEATTMRRILGRVGTIESDITTQVRSFQKGV